MLRVFVSPSSEARQRWAWESIAPHCRTSEVLLLAPSRGAADDFLRRNATGILGVHRYSVSQFAAGLASSELAERGLTVATHLGREALAARAIFSERRNLEYFAAVADTPGFSRAAASTLNELRLAGITPAQLETAGTAGRDLARILARYVEQLRDKQLADQAVVLEIAAARIAAGGVPVLWLDVRPASRRERELLEALAGDAPTIAATALTGDEDSVRWLTGLAGSPPEIDEGPGNTSLLRVRRFVFTYEENAPAEPDATLDFFSAAGEALESAEIARRVRKLASSGTPFDHIAVLLRQPDAYAPLLEDAFRRAGIPAYFTQGALRPDPAGRALLALIDCALEKLPASRFAEYLSLGQLPNPNLHQSRDREGADRPESHQRRDRKGAEAPPLPYGRGSEAPGAEAPPLPYGRGSEAPGAGPAWAPSADELTRTPYTGESPSPAPAPESTSVEAPWAWERLLVDASVIGGHDRWVRRLRGLEHEFQAKLAEAAEDESRRQHYQREIERLRSLESFALPLIEFLHGLPKQALWSEWLGLLRELARRALRSAVSVLPLFDELETMGDLGPVDLEEVAAVLRERLRFLRTPPPDRRYGQVFVASIDETATRSFDVVFLPSLAEGLFPRKPFEDPLLLDAARRKLSPDLETQSGRLLRERLRLRIAASTASQRLVVSYPRIDLATSRPRVPSFYALEVIRAAEGHLPDFRTLEKRAAAAATSRLGWPAPVDPRDALDDTEHDLSVLGPLMSRPAAEARGRARYILRANPHLARSLRARGRRWRREWFEPDGLVQADQPVMDLLAKHGFAARPYSASALQNFAQCPYKFFLQAIQRLRPREEAAPLEQIDPMTRGALIHTAQFRFFRKLDAAGQLPVHPLRVSKVLDALDATLDEVASEYAEKLAPAIPRVWRNEVESIRTDLRAWIHDCAHGQQTWKPIHFEFAFGLPPEMDRDTASVAEPVTLLAGALRLRGSIDLVETDGDTVRVTDHKTGKAPETLPYGIGGGEILQPVLYALAAEQLFHKPVHSGSLYFCTQRGAYTRADIPLRDDIRSRARFAVDTIREAIEEGFLPAAPRKGACDQCDYRPVCGPYEELRTRRKRQERLNALQQLRNTP